MSPELDKKLCEKYPKIFVNRDSSAQASCMHWGFSHSDGWYRILELFCEAATCTYATSTHVDDEDGKRLGLKLNKYSDKYYLEINPPMLIADQVKEKFGTLRFYYHLKFDPVVLELSKSGKYPEIVQIIERYNAHFDGMVHMLEIASSMTCEVSGKEGELHVSGGNRYGWYRTLNKEEAINNPELKVREFVPVSSLSNKELI